MSGSLTGKVVIVTSGSRNIGLAAAAGLVRRGARVAILGRDPVALAEARERLGEVATVVDGGPQVRMRRLVEDLHDRGTRRLTMTTRRLPAALTTWSQ